MNILQRHIAKSLLISSLISLAVLLVVVFFINFVNEVDQIGQGDYGLVQAMIYTALHMPAKVYELFPVASLFGCIFGLGALAAQSEITVMRASGVSVWQIVQATLIAAVALIICVSLVGELVVPMSVHFAENKKTAATTSGQAMRTESGMWARVGDSFIHINKIVSKNDLDDVLQYRFDAQHHLLSELHADSAVFRDANWYLKNVRESQITANQITTTSSPELLWPIHLNPRFLASASMAPEEMPITTLHRYIVTQNRNHIQVASYEYDFWSRIIRPLTTIVMMLIAIPFIFMSLTARKKRSGLVFGLLFSFVFYMLNRFFGPISLVFQLPAFLAALLPTLVFAAIAFFLLARTR